MKIFILTITEHSKFGYLFMPCLAVRNNKTLDDIERLHGTDPEAPWLPVGNIEKEIIRLAGNYHDHEIRARFARPKEMLTSFLARVDDKYISEHIRPFIEKSMSQIFEIVRHENIPLYPFNRNRDMLAGDALYANDQPAEIVFRFERSGDSIIYRQSILVNGAEVILRGRNPIVLTEDPCRLIIDKEIVWFSEQIDHKKITPFFEKEHLVIPSRTEKMWFEKFLIRTVSRFQVDATGFEIEELQGNPEVVLHLEKSWRGDPVFRPTFVYESSKVNQKAKIEVFTKLIERDDRYDILKLHRNFEKEREALGQLQNLGLTTYEDNNLTLTENDNREASNDLHRHIEWLADNSEKLSSMGIAVNQEYYGNIYNTGKHELQLRYKTGHDWFEINGVVIFRNFEIPFVSLRRHILQNIREYLLPDETIFIIPEAWFSRFSDIFLYGLTAGTSVRIASHHASLLKSEAIEQKEISQKIEDLTKGGYDDYSVPAGLKAQLRAYQVEGFRWLMHLRKNKLNGCLADDMGLGKTLQTIALLCAGSESGTAAAPARNDKGSNQLSLYDMFEPEITNNVRQNKDTGSISLPSLLVMPTTLIFNWRSELRKFAPHLKVVVYSGVNRKSLLSSFSEADVVLTSYSIARIDAEVLQDIRFHHLILDESQVIKNPSSKTYRSLLQYTSEHRLVLSGTPIENSLTDLYAQMHFLNRDMFGSLKFFKRHFAIPILRQTDTGGHHEAMEKLQAMIAPFIMRRTKAEVASELPPKTEQIMLCRMKPEQEKIYEEEKSKVRNFIFEQLQQDETARSSTLIITALSRLRQIACHPAMVFPDTLAGSGKLETITGNIKILTEERHKILVISSYVKHLKHIGEWLDKERIPFTALTGKTKNHQRVIDRFRSDENIRVMLMSLKKGGYGLNLTEADYVLITDPWWNPAAQQQGMDRVHRIGQDKPVFVYRFITRGTVEERILQMQKEKKRIADTFISANNPLAYITPAGLNYLLDADQD